MSADGSAGQQARLAFKPSMGLSLIYLLCLPWPYRVPIMRVLKRLEDSISISAISPLMLKNGWAFTRDKLDANGDDLYQLNYLPQLYQKQ